MALFVSCFVVPVIVYVYTAYKEMMSRQAYKFFSLLCCTIS